MKNSREILEGLRSGENESFEYIYNKYYKLIYARIYNIINEQSLTESLVNDTFLKIHNNIKKFQIKNDNIELSFCKWVSTIAINTAINEYNKIKKEKCVRIEDINNIKDNNQNYDDIVDEYLSMLESEELQIVIYRIYYELTFKEIANIVKRTESIVNKKYHKAILKVKKYYKNIDK